MFFYYQLLKPFLSLFPYLFLSFLTHSLFQLTHPFLSFPYSLPACQPSRSSSLPARRSSSQSPSLLLSLSPSLSLSLSASLSLSPSLSPPQPTLHLPPLTDDNNGRFDGSNGRPDDSSGSRSGCKFGSVGLGFPMGVDYFWVGFPGEF